MEYFFDYDELNRKLAVMICNQKYYLRADRAEQENAREELLQASFYYHYSHNEFYRKLCEKTEVNPQMVRKLGAESIPLIPIHLFKDQNSHLLLTKALKDIEFELKSTGTSGIPNVSRRDKDTVDLLSQALAAMYREYFGISTGCGLFLCPSPAEVPEMGMVKALNFLSGMLDDRVYLVERYSFRSADAVALLNDWQDRFDRYIIGPPFMINRLLQYLKTKNMRLKLDPKSKIIMLGGWKRFTGEQISRATFNELCVEYLGIATHQVRDMYGLVEANFLAIECEQGHKHVPPWVKIVLRELKDPDRIVRTPGREGLITILDPLSFAYPAFIQTEDVGRIDSEERCACGRTSQTLAFHRRVEGAELGCCAINMERYMEDETIETLCDLVGSS